MSRFRNYTPQLVAALVAAALVGGATPARADFRLRYKVDGGAFTTVLGTLLPNGTWVVGANILGVDISATASAFGNTSAATTLMDTSANGIVFGAHTIVVETTFTDILTAPPPQTATYNMTGSNLGALGGSITMQDWVDVNNGLFNTSAPITTGALAPGSNGTFEFSASPPYSLTQRTTISTGSGITSFSSDNNLQLRPAPAPASLILLASGAPVFTFGWLRRRKVTGLAS